MKIDPLFLPGWAGSIEPLLFINCSTYGYGIYWTKNGQFIISTQPWNIVLYIIEKPIKEKRKI